MTVTAPGERVQMGSHLDITLLDIVGSETNNVKT